MNRVFNEYKTIVTPKILIGLLYSGEANIQFEKYLPKKSNKIPTNPEQYKLILNDVLNKDFNFVSSSTYSEVYLTTPVLMAPFAKVSTILIKLEKAPINATPVGPVYIAITLLATNPEEIRITAIIPEKKEVLNNVKNKN